MKTLRHASRRRFLAQMLGAAAGLAVRPAVAAAATSMRPASQAGRRRIIWNNDGDDLRFLAFGIRRLWTARDPDEIPLPERFSSVQEFLDLRMTALQKLPVDTVSYCGVFNWPIWDLPRERIAALGPDPFVPILDFVHRAGKELFFNLRMNDCHSSLRFNGPAWWEPFRLRNPHLLQSNIAPEEWEKRFLPWIRGESKVYPLQDVQDRRGPANRDIQSWSAYDYAKPEVRKYFLGLIRQACERYDLDGIDLDWLRHPFFFRFGEERRGIPLMNDFVRQVAATVRAAGARRGRPMALAMRVPDTPDRALEIGLDVATWISEGWLDLLIAGNGLTAFSAPVKPWLDLASGRGIPVYGCITRNAPGLADPLAFRGVAQRLWANGVSGLYHFNHFIPAEYGTITDTADRGRLADLSKAYLVDTSYTRSQNGTVFSGPLPLELGTCAGTCAAELPLEIPEPLDGRAVRLEVQWRGAGAAERSRWQINGTGVSRAGDHGHATNLAYSADPLRPGANRLRVTVTPSGSPATLLLTAVRVVAERSP